MRADLLWSRGAIFHYHTTGLAVFFTIGGNNAVVTSSHLNDANKSGFRIMIRAMPNAYGGKIPESD